MSKKIFQLLSLSVIALSVVAAPPELTIVSDKAYKKADLPVAKYPSGIWGPKVPVNWMSIDLSTLEWKYKKIYSEAGLGNPLDDQGMKDGFYKKDYDASDWEKFTAPGWWPDMKPHEKAKLGWLRLKFDLPEKAVSAEHRIVLDFRRCSSQTDVWINGEKVGKRHKGRFASFQFDITDKVEVGKNIVAIRVFEFFNHTKYWHRMHTGLTHSVRLFSIPTKLFSFKMMVTPKLMTNKVAIQAEIINSGNKVLILPLTVKITEVESGKIVTTNDTGKITIVPGASWVDLGETKIPNPKYWSPENPFRYAVELIDHSGVSIGCQSFGFRSFQADGQWLKLNGKKFKPRAIQFILSWQKRWWLNEDGDLEKLLRFLKGLGVNMLRPHSNNAIMPETCYELCDRLGILIYEDWPGNNYARAYEKKVALLDMWPSYTQHLRDYYSHPSLCMFSFGNEYYEGHSGKFYTDQLTKLYHLVKALDKQNRPICSSTGRQTWEAMKAQSLHEPTDVLDDHQYRGAVCGSWEDNIQHINNYAKVAMKYYGSKPKINCEYGNPGSMLRYRPITFRKVRPAFLDLDPASAEFKKQYIGFLRSPKAEVGGYIRGKLNFMSPRIYALDPKLAFRLAAVKRSKRPIEIYRRAGIKCIGGHTNDSPSGLLRYATTKKDKYGNNWWMNYPKPMWITMPLAYTLKRVYNPTLVSASPFNLHPLPGSKQEIDIVVTNDLNENGNFKVVAQLRLDGKATSLEELDFGKIKGMKQKTITLKYQVPKLDKTLRGHLELYLFKNGVRVGDNLYPITVSVCEPITQPVEKIALYDAARRVFGDMTSTTTRVLSVLGVKCETIKKFENLDQYKYLIIGNNSFDKTLLDASHNINKWICKGGKLLCFEQSMCGKIPFYSNYNITAGSSATFVSQSVPTHPVWKNLKQEDMDTWAGNCGLMFHYALSPLNEGLVAIAPTSSAHDLDDVKPVIADVKLKKGQIVFSQLAATERIATDSVARTYLRNLLAYFVSTDDLRFALELPDMGVTKAVYVDNKDAFFVDLRPFANRGFADTKSNDRKGGWADFGAAADFKEIPPGISRLQGGVPFNIINPSTNGGKSCMVFKGAKRPWFPDKIENIPLGVKLNSIYMLQTSMYAQKGGVLKYVFHYANGEKREFDVEMGYGIGDWWFPQDKPNAIVVFRTGRRGLYMTEFVNPLPKVKIKSMDILSYGKSVPIVISITGRKRFQSVISGVGEK